MFPPLTNEALSSIAGSVSIGSWVVVTPSYFSSYPPTMTAPVWENYMLKSGEGLSVPFILLWLAGDVTNLLGGALAHLLPTMITLAVYYTICDIVLLFQVYYYRALRRKREAANDERAPLLEQPEPEIAQLKPLLPAKVMYPLLVTFVFLFGVGAWLLEAERPIKVPENPDVEFDWTSQALGYASCFLYIGSRVPQIFHNMKTRCEGLSLAMFAFAMLGNVTYIASILFKSMAPDYLIINASWIAGALFTIFLDIFVLGQFAYYSYQDQHKAAVFSDGSVGSEA